LGESKVDVDLLRLAVSLMMPMQGGQFTGDYSLDINPTFALELPAMRHYAMTLPWAVVHGPGSGLLENSDHIRHELAHVDQQEALGPAFWPAYLLMAGREFEPYTPSDFSLSPRAESMLITPGDTERMWQPSDEQRGAFPLFRFAKEGNTTSAAFMPGYPQLLTIRDVPTSPTISKQLVSDKKW
jgi:hypothetical protein